MYISCRFIDMFYNLLAYVIHIVLYSFYLLALWILMTIYAFF